MRRLIRADIRRILLKIGFYVLPAIYLLISISDTQKGDYGFEDMYQANQFTYKYMISYFAIIPVFMSVYADELRSGAWVVAIGRGMSRRKIVMAKFLDGTILTILLYAFFFALDVVGMARHMITPTALQMERAVLLNVASCLKAISFMGFASVFVYLTWNASVGIIVEIIATAFSEMALGWVQEQFRIPMLDMSFIGQVDQACANFAAGRSCVLQFAVVIVYVAAFILISMALYGRKELEL